MSSDLENLGVNPSVNPLFRDVVEARLSRRTLLQGGLAAAAVTLLPTAVRCS